MSETSAKVLKLRRGDTSVTTSAIVRRFYEHLPAVGDALPERTLIGVDLVALDNRVELVPVLPDGRDTLRERITFDLFGTPLRIITERQSEKIDCGEEVVIRLGRYMVILQPVRASDDLAAIWIEVVDQAHRVKICQEDRKKREAKAKEEAEAAERVAQAEQRNYEAYRWRPWDRWRFLFKTLKSEIYAVLDL